MIVNITYECTYCGLKKKKAKKIIIHEISCEYNPKNIKDNSLMDDDDFYQ